jgi:hypothetical protein
MISVQILTARWIRPIHLLVNLSHQLSLHFISGQSPRRHQSDRDRDGQDRLDFPLDLITKLAGERESSTSAESAASTKTAVTTGCLIHVPLLERTYVRAAGEPLRRRADLRKRELHVARPDSPRVNLSNVRSAIPESEYFAHAWPGVKINMETCFLASSRERRRHDF